MREFLECFAIFQVDILQLFKQFLGLRGIAGKLIEEEDKCWGDRVAGIVSVLNEL
jgi:hypothetical protein